MNEDDEIKDARSEAGSPCGHFSEHLSAYLEGKDHPELLAHAVDCEFCQCLLADVQLIRGAAAALGPEDPAPRVWANVRVSLVEEGVIHHSRRAGWRMPLTFLRRPMPVAAAAAVIAVIVLFKVPGVLVHQRVEPTSVIHAAVFRQSYMRPQDIANLKQAIKQLESTYSANFARIEPSLKPAYQKSLASLDDEIHECQVSMHEQPQDELAREYLSRAYIQKAQLLQSALDYNLR